MADKRFLGLGFTFAATDNGLEKKLTSVSSILSDISSTLDEITASAAQAGSALGKMKGPSASRSSVAKSPVKKMSASSKKDDCCAKLLDFFKKHVSVSFVPKGLKPAGRLKKALNNNKPVSKPTMAAPPPGPAPDPASPMLDHRMRQITGTFEELLPKLSVSAKQTLTDMRDAISNSFGPEVFEGFLHSLDDTIISINDSGKQFEDFTGRTERQLRRNFEAFVKGAADAKVSGKSFEGLQIAIKGVGVWASDVKDSLLGLAEEIGLNIRKIIPPQVMAGLNVLKSVAMGPVNLLKYLGAKAKEKLSKKFQDDVKNSIGKGSKNKNVIKQLDTLINAKEGKSNDDGFFGMLKRAGEAVLEFLGGFALLAPVITALKWGFGLLSSAVTFLWDAITGVVEFFESNFVRAAITEAFEALGAFFVEAAAVVFSPFGALVAAIAAAIAATGVVIYGFVKQIREDWDQWKEVFGRIGKAIAQIVQNIADTFPILKIIGGAIWSAGKFVVDAFTSVGSTLIDTVKEIGSAVWGFVKTVFDKILTFLSSIGSGLAKNALGIFKSVAGGLESAADATKPGAPAASIAGTPGLNQSLALQESLLDANKDHSKKLDAQNQLASDQKDLLQRLLDHFEGQKPDQPGVKVNIGFDARKWGIASEQTALNEAAAVGR